MYEPRKINLYLENELPTTQIIHRSQSGGNIDLNLINNKSHKYIKAENKITTFIYGAPRVEENVQLWFEFNNEYMITDEINPNLYYIEKSNNSISFNIKQLKKISNVAIKNMPGHDLTLKLVDLTYKDINTFIEEWKTYNDILENSIPHIYMYGELYTKDNKFISYYYITKKYKNHISLLKLDFDYTIKFIINMLLFLEKCNANNIILRNFKFSGLGFDFIDNEIKFVLLDYNDVSLIKTSEKYFKSFSDGCDAMCAGTLVPYFIVYDFFEMNTNWIDKLDKLYIVGLAEILIFLLYNQDEIMEKLFKMLYNPSYLKPCLHYYHFMKLFDDDNNKKTFMDLLNSLIPKFVEIDSKFINPMFKRIIINCFETKYNAIKTPITYLNNLKGVFNDYKQLKAGIKTYINPINTNNTQLTQITQSIPTHELIDERDFQKETLKDVELEKPQETQEIQETQETQDFELKELKQIVDTDDIIPVKPYKPYTDRPKDEYIKPILRRSTSGAIKPKKVGFIDAIP
jgi:hypothetical protein